MIGTPLIRLETVDSTNSKLKELAKKGAAEGTVLMADAQTEGRGRRGNVWESPAGENIYCSIVLKPKINAEDTPQMTVMTGVALADYLNEAFSLPITLKWPNDIYCNGKKLGGILCEMKIKKKILEFVIVGLGLNVNSPLESFSKGLQKSVSSLFLETGRDYDREEVLKGFFPYLEKEYKAFLAGRWHEIEKRFNEYA